MGAGATCAITDPAKMTGMIRAADLLLGRDEYAGRFIKYYRQQQAILKDTQGVADRLKPSRTQFSIIEGMCAIGITSLS